MKRWIKAFAITTAMVGVMVGIIALGAWSQLALVGAIMFLILLVLVHGVLSE